MKVHLPSRLSKCPEKESVLVIHGEPGDGGSSGIHSVCIVEVHNVLFGFYFLRNKKMC